MNYELAKQLKDAGFPQLPGLYYVGKELWDETQQSDYKNRRTPPRDTWIKAPTLSELIEACGEEFGSLSKGNNGIWYATQWAMKEEVTALIPIEAVTKLWLALNQKQ